MFLHTNRFRRTPGRADLLSKQYSASRTVVLPHPTNSTIELLRYAQSALTSIFAFGYQFQKVGIILADLMPGDYRQKGVFVDGPDERLLKLAGVVYAINDQHGADKLRLASQLYSPDWPMQQTYLSRRYTTRWEEILEAK